MQSGLPKLFATHNDPKTPLPFLQLGDIFSKGLDDPVYAVMSASCDLQFVPEEVSTSRIPDRRDTILLLPGTICLPNECPKKSLSTGLVKINGEWRAVVWDRRKLTGLPHCLVRSLLQEDAGYNHSIRLRTARALELQQQVFHQASRIGLEVQPPFSDKLDLQVFARKADGVVQADKTITAGMIRFHMPGASVLVIKKSAIDELIEILNALVVGGEQTNEGTKLSQLIESINRHASALSRTPLAEPAFGKIKAIKSADKSSGVAINGLGLLVREPSDALEDCPNSFNAVISIGNSSD